MRVQEILIHSKNDNLETGYYLEEIKYEDNVMTETYRHIFI